MHTFAVLRVLALVGATFAVTGAVAAAADPPQPQTDSAVISGNSFNGAGAVRVNQTAGNGNVQANVASIGRSGVPLSITQSTDATGPAIGRASVADFAFANATGLVQLNQSAGTGNAQANAAFVRYGVSASQLNDAALSALVPIQHTSSATQPSAGGNVVSRAATAFAHASGIVQVSQVAGSGNSTANAFLLQIQANVAGH